MFVDEVAMFRVRDKRKKTYCLCETKGKTLPASVTEMIELFEKPSRRSAIKRGLSTVTMGWLYS